jgi:hypothetical protein
MRGIGWLVSAIALTAAVLAPQTAAADTMDPAFGRLVSNESCRTFGPPLPGAPPGTLGPKGYYNPKSGFQTCGLDNAAFRNLVAQYGAAFAPTVMHSSRTTGFGGLQLQLEGAFTTIDNSPDKNATYTRYWEQGTEGPRDPNNKLFSTKNVSPPSMLQLYTLKIRKGFPFGFELVGNFGYMSQTSVYTIGADVRWSLFEGFRTGIPAIFPELAVGGSVRTITGTDQLQLTVASADGELSKPFAIGGAVVVTPYVGYQYLRIFGDSGLIDLTPNTDAVNYCGYSGSNNPATPDRSKPGVFDGQPVCPHGSSADFNNTAVFNPARLNRHRMFGGLQIRVQWVLIGGQFMMDVVDVANANSPTDNDKQTLAAEGKGKTNMYQDVKRQMTIAFDVGAVF